jgi:hypothetical protein
MLRVQSINARSGFPPAGRWRLAASLVREGLMDGNGQEFGLSIGDGASLDPELCRVFLQKARSHHLRLEYRESPASLRIVACGLPRFQLGR